MRLPDVLLVTALLALCTPSTAIANDGPELYGRCGTAQAASLRPWPAEPPNAQLRSRPKNSHLLERDAFGALPNVAFSEHFALKWGPTLSLDEEVADSALAVLETVLAIETEEPLDAKEAQDLLAGSPGVEYWTDDDAGRRRRRRGER